MRDIARKLKRKLKKTDTDERCGLILQDGMILTTANVHDTPQLGFRIPGADLLVHENVMIGTWHTHPNKTSVLSQDDYDGFMNWPDLTHFVIGNDGVRAYRVEVDVIRELDLAAE